MTKAACISCSTKKRRPGALAIPANAAPKAPMDHPANQQQARPRKALQVHLARPALVAPKAYVAISHPAIVEKTPK